MKASWSALDRTFVSTRSLVVRHVPMPIVPRTMAAAPRIMAAMEMVDCIVNALDRLNQDSTARVAILTGAGTAFSSGGDLRKMQAEFATRAKNRI